jgi:hypothetical protein
MPNVVVPVGFLMGPEFGPEGPPDRPPLHYEVHFGDQPQELSETEFAVWAAAFVDPRRHAGLEVDRGSLEQHLHDDDGLVGPIADPAPLVSSLLERGLLVEFDPEAGALQELFSGLRLFPQGQGLGSTPDEPTRYRIGFGNQPVAEVTGNVYELWSYSLVFPTLWDACVDMAAAAATAPAGGESLDVSPELLAGEVAAAIPLLVSAGAAFVDPLTYEVR